MANKFCDKSKILVNLGVRPNVLKKITQKSIRSGTFLFQIKTWSVIQNVKMSPIIGRNGTALACEPTKAIKGYPSPK